MIRYDPVFDISVPDIAFFGEVGKGDLGYAPCDDHMHRRIEFHHILSGSETFIVDGDEFTVTDSPGGFVMIFPYQVHNNSVNTTCRHISGTISPEILRSPDTLSKYRPASAFIPEKDLPPFFPDLLMWTNNLYLTMTDENRAAAKPLILDKYYISKLFSAKLGVRYVEFVRSQRISQACEMLRASDRAITDIAYDCGFRNQSTFNRVFREMTGMSPREYRVRK